RPVERARLVSYPIGRPGHRAHVGHRPLPEPGVRMSAVTDAMDGLRTALGGVEGVRLYRDYSASMDPPALTLGPPDVTWDAVCAAPTSATVVAYLIVKADDRAVDRLVSLLEEVTDAVEATRFAVVCLEDRKSTRL